MPPRSIASGIISFGLVAIPVKLYSAASSQSVSYNLLHAKCGNRIREQRICPVCNDVVEKTDLIKGFEFAKDQYVRLSDEDLKGLEGEASEAIEITEFVPLAKVDPIYFEKTYYLGPDKGGEKPYRLLADTMTKAAKVALAKFIMRGKDNLVLVRAARNGLMLHTMYFADEVRSFDEIAKGETAKIGSAETNLALRLVDELSNQEFEAEKYEDQYRQRVMELVATKAEGKDIPVATPQAKRAQVIDLMAALKESLGRKSNLKGRKPAIRAKAIQPERDKKRVQSAKK